MYELEKTFNFEAGHELAYHDGKCRHPHGHSYSLTINVRGNALQASGPKKNMLIDFSDVSAIVRPMIKKYFDHKWLNDTLQTDSPTTEFIAKWVYEHLKDQIPGLYSISIKETMSSKVTYTQITPKIGL